MPKKPPKRIFLSLAPDKANTKLVSAKGNTGESLVKKINFNSSLRIFSKILLTFLFSERYDLNLSPSMRLVMIFTRKMATIFIKKTGKTAFHPIKYPKIRAKRVGGVKANVQVRQQRRVISVQICQLKAETVFSWVMTAIVRAELKIKGITVKKIEEMSGNEYFFEIFKPIKLKISFFS